MVGGDEFAVPSIPREGGSPPIGIYREGVVTFYGDIVSGQSGRCGELYVRSEGQGGFPFGDSLVPLGFVGDQIRPGIDVQIAQRIAVTCLEGFPRLGKGIIPCRGRYRDGQLTRAQIQCPRSQSRHVNLVRLAHGKNRRIGKYNGKILDFNSSSVQADHRERRIKNMIRGGDSNRVQGYIRPGSIGGEENGELQQSTVMLQRNRDILGSRTLRHGKLVREKGHGFQPAFVGVLGRIGYRNIGGSGVLAVGVKECDRVWVTFHARFGIRGGQVVFPLGDRLRSDKIGLGPVG